MSWVVRWTAVSLITFYQILNYLCSCHDESGTNRVDCRGCFCHTFIRSCFCCSSSYWSVASGYCCCCIAKGCALCSAERFCLRIVKIKRFRRISNNYYHLLTWWLYCHDTMILTSSRLMVGEWKIFANVKPPCGTGILMACLVGRWHLQHDLCTLTFTQ